MKKAIEASLRESRVHLSSKGRLDEESLAASTLTNTILDHSPFGKQGHDEQPLIDFLSDPTPSSDSQALV